MEETLTTPFLFWVGLDMFCKSMNFDTKLVVAILGQDFALVVILSWTLFAFTIPYESFTSGILRQPYLPDFLQ